MTGMSKMSRGARAEAADISGPTRQNNMENPPPPVVITLDDDDSTTEQRPSPPDNQQPSTSREGFGSTSSRCSNKSSGSLSNDPMCLFCRAPQSKPLRESTDERTWLIQLLCSSAGIPEHKWPENCDNDEYLLCSGCLQLLNELATVKAAIKEMVKQLSGLVHKVEHTVVKSVIVIRTREELASYPADSIELPGREGLRALLYEGYKTTLAERRERKAMLASLNIEEGDAWKPFTVTVKMPLEIPQYLHDVVDLTEDDMVDDESEQDTVGHETKQDIVDYDFPANNLDDDLPADDLELADDDLDLPHDNVDQPDDDLELADDDLELADDDLELADDDLELADDDLDLPHDDVDQPDDDVDLPEDDVDQPDDDVDLPEDDVSGDNLNISEEFVSLDELIKIEEVEAAEDHEFDHSQNFLVEHPSAEEESVPIVEDIVKIEFGNLPQSSRDFKYYEFTNARGQFRRVNFMGTPFSREPIFDGGEADDYVHVCRGCDYSYIGRKSKAQSLMKIHLNRKHSFTATKSRPVPVRGSNGSRGSLKRVSVHPCGTNTASKITGKQKMKSLARRIGTSGGGGPTSDNFCITCGKSFSSRSNYTTHLKSKVHQRNHAGRKQDRGSK